jgi:hypothetical protein
VSLLSQFVLVVLLAGALLLSVWLRSEEEPRFPSGEPFSGEQLERLHQIRDTVSELRGIEPSNAIGEAVVTRDSIRAYYDEAYTDVSHQERRLQDSATLAYRLLRMLGPEDTIEGVSSSSVGSLAIGFYVPRERRLVVVDDVEVGSLGEESTIAHEYVHALQDGAFNISSYRGRAWREEDTEYGTTASCVVEGDARIAEQLYLEEVYGPNWYSLYLAEFDDEAAQDAFEAAAVPDAMLRYFYFNYVECADFIFDIYTHDGWKGVDRLYEEPPATTEQVLHPDKYRSAEPPLHVEVVSLTRSLGVGWRPVGHEVFGEFDVYNYLLTGKLSTAAASAAAKGWGGGQMSIYTRGLSPEQDVVLHIALVWDSPFEMRQFQVAFATALERLGYESTSTDGDLWTWSSAGEYGWGTWDEPANRVDLLYSTDHAALARAAEVID